MQPTTPSPKNNDTLQTLIPTKNKLALFAYYFGVFGFMPFLGLPLSIAAVVCGYKGLNRYHTIPTPGAKGHAIAGIVMGLLQLAVFATFIVVMIIVRTQ